MLLVYNCCGCFLSDQLSESVQFFPSSFIQIWLLLLGIFTVAEIICRGWMWIFDTRINVCYQGLVLSSLIHSWVLLLVSHSVFRLHQGLVILFFFHVVCSFILFFVLSVPISCSKTVLFPLYPVVYCPCAFSSDLTVEFFLIFWMVLFSLYWLTLSYNLLYLPSMANIF